MASAIQRLHARIEDERGFTLIEVLVAASLLAVALVTMISTFDYSRRVVSTSEAVEVASHRGEAEIERLRALPYLGLALPATPSQSSDPSNPDYYVTGSSYQWDQGSTGPRSEPLVVDAANSRLTHSSTWTDVQSRLSGSVYRYVTAVGGSNGKARRLTVVVTVNNSDLKKPVLISSISVNPATAP
jgi:prepilin-type N-terminal cleavage/methylation domain-containing protein